MRKIIYRCSLPSLPEAVGQSAWMGVYEQNAAVAKWNEAASIADLLPEVGSLRILRQWAGTNDMTMDGSPIMDRVGYDNVFVNAGWCYGGFKTIPASGAACATLIQPNQTVIVDAGTTCYHVAKHLEAKSPHIITNSLPVAHHFSSSSKAEVVVSGGLIKDEIRVVCGSIATINGTTYVGGITGPVAIRWLF